MALVTENIARLKSQLLTSGLSSKDSPLFQVVDQLIDATLKTTNDINTQIFPPSSGGGILGQTFITIDRELPFLPNSVQLVAGQGIQLSRNTGKLVISVNIPLLKGDTGERGDRGPIGPKGDRGRDGLQGPRGRDGNIDDLLPILLSAGKQNPRAGSYIVDGDITSRSNNIGLVGADATGRYRVEIGANSSQGNINAFDAISATQIQLQISCTNFVISANGTVSSQSSGNVSFQNFSGTSKVTINITTGDITLNINNSYLYGTTTTPATKHIIGINGSNIISIDSDGLGSVFGTALIVINGGQIKFPATQIPSADVNTFDDYKEGTWTPVDNSGAGLSFSGVTAKYTKVGRRVNWTLILTYPVTASGSNTDISGLPYTVSSGGGAAAVGYQFSGIVFMARTLASTVRLAFYTVAGVSVTNVQLSGVSIELTGSYDV